jgi:hypothetical protein
LRLPLTSFSGTGKYAAYRRRSCEMGTLVRK